MYMSSVRVEPEMTEVSRRVRCIANTTGQASEHQRMVKVKVESKEHETPLG